MSVDVQHAALGKSSYPALLHQEKGLGGNISEYTHVWEMHPLDLTHDALSDPTYVCRRHLCEYHQQTLNKDYIYQSANRDSSRSGESGYDSPPGTGTGPPGGGVGGGGSVGTGPALPDIHQQLPPLHSNSTFHDQHSPQPISSSVLNSNSQQPISSQPLSGDPIRSSAATTSTFSPTYSTLPCDAKPQKPANQNNRNQLVLFDMDTNNSVDPASPSPRAADL